MSARVKAALATLFTVALIGAGFVFERVELHLVLTIATAAVASVGIFALWMIVFEPDECEW